MGWIDNLSAGVRDALQRGEKCRIAVHNENQRALGQIAADRIAAQMGASADDLTFEVIPESETERYPVGAILV